MGGYISKTHVGCAVFGNHTSGFNEPNILLLHLNSHKLPEKSPRSASSCSTAARAKMEIEHDSTRQMGKCWKQPSAGEVLRSTHQSHHFEYSINKDTSSLAKKCVPMTRANSLYGDFIVRDGKSVNYSTANFSLNGPFIPPFSIASHSYVQKNTGPGLCVSGGFWFKTPGKVRLQPGVGDLDKARSGWIRWCLASPKRMRN